MWRWTQKASDTISISSAPNPICNVNRTCGVCRIVSEYNRSMRKLCLPLLALSLVIAACGKQEEAPPPKTDNAGGPPITSNTDTSPTKPTGDDPLKSMENVKKNLKAIQQNIAPVAPGTKSWTKTKTKAEGFALVAESRLAALKAVSGEATTQVNIAGQRGMSISKIAIRNSNEFLVEYAKVTVEPQPLFQKEALVGNGKTYATNALSSTGWSPARPVTALRDEGKLDVSRWATEFPRTLFSALQGGKPLTNLLTAAKAEGLTVLAEDRSVTAGGRVVKQHRIFISRKPEDLKKKGKFDCEVVIDDLRMMPVTIRSAIAEVGQKPVNLEWTIRWNFALAQKFDDKSFVIPNPSGSANRTAKL